MFVRTKWALLAALVIVTSLAAVAEARHFSAWAPAQKIDEIGRNSSELNTPFLDGCPIQSQDGLSLYMASNRPGGQGLLDIWVARRESRSDPWGAPENLGAPINTAADDFCPTPVGKKGLLFVSRKTTSESCGMGDIYFSRFNPSHGWAEPEHFACAPVGPNSPLDEQGPSLLKTGGRGLLYFSSGSATVAGDIYVAERLPQGGFGPAGPVAELNSTGNDIQPNVRKDGLELVLSSNRAGTLGGQDIWIATRESVHEAWSAPVNAGAGVNTGAAETRPSLSKKGNALLFGRAPGPEGMSDIYLSTRTRLRGPHR